MARIYPFRALRYDPARVNMEDVVTQPYDKITPAMQERYYEASPYNLVRIILGKQFPTDNEHENVYTRAAETLREWRKQQILVEESEPALYGYSQTYTVPHTSERVRRVSGEVLVRWASLTALAHGPSASKRHSKPPRSISWPEALNT